VLWEEWSKLEDIGIELVIGEAILWYGFAGVGKTRFSAYFPTLLLYRYLKDNNKLTDKTTFVVINTDRSFSLRDLRKLCEANGISFQAIQKHLWLEKVRSMQELLSTCHAVFRAIKEKRNDVKLIAIDKVNDPYFEDIISFEDKSRFLSHSRELTGDLTELLKKLLAYADDYGILVSLSARRRKPKPGQQFKRWYQEIYAGYVIQYAPSVVVKLEKVSEIGSKAKLKVVKNRHGEEGGELVVRFTDDGFKV